MNCFVLKGDYSLKVITIIFIMSVLFDTSFAAEKLAPAGDKQVLEIFVQTGHASGVTFLAIDKNERYLVSVENTSDDRFLKIWEIYRAKRSEQLKLIIVYATLI